MLWIGDGYNEKTKKDSHGLQVFALKQLLFLKFYASQFTQITDLKSKILLEEFVWLSFHSISFYLIAEAATKVLIAKFWQF